MVSAMQVSGATYLVNPFSLSIETPTHPFRAVSLIYFIDDLYLLFPLFSLFGKSLFGYCIACPRPLSYRFYFFFCLYYLLCSLFLQPYYWVQFLFSKSFCFYKIHYLILWLQYLLLPIWRCYTDSLFFFIFFFHTYSLLFCPRMLSCFCLYYLFVVMYLPC